MKLNPNYFCSLCVKLDKDPLGRKASCNFKQEKENSYNTIHNSEADIVLNLKSEFHQPSTRRVDMTNVPRQRGN